VIERHPQAGDDDVRLFLLGSPLVALLQQRGQLVLNGGMVQVDGGCAVFAGPSGVGKSTLAFALHQRGYPMLSDDVCAITFEENGAPYAVGSYPQAKLWPDSLEQLNIDRAGLRRVRPCLKKRAVPLDRPFKQDRLRMKRLYWLCASRHNPEIALRPITGPGKIKMLRDATFRPEFLTGSDQTACYFRQLASIAQDLSATEVMRPAGDFRLGQLVDTIEGDLRS
jgi:hypothetical protein